MKKIFSILILSCLASSLSAQFNTGRTWSDFYVFDPKIANPAFAGLNEKQNLLLVADFDMQPSYATSVNGYMLSGDSKVEGIGGAVGVVIGINSSDFFSVYSQSLMYTYQHKVSADAELGIGMGVNLNQYAIYLFSDWDGQYTPYGQVPKGNVNGVNADVDLGLSYKYKSFLLGLSMQNAAASKAKFTDGLSAYNSRQVNVFSQTIFRLGPKFSLEPTLMYVLYLPRTYSSQSILDVNLLLRFSKKVFIGAKLSPYKSYSNDYPVGPVSVYAGLNLTDYFQVAMRARLNMWSMENQYSDSYVGVMLKYGFNNKM